MSLGPTDRDVDDVTGGTHYKMYLYILQIIFLSNLQIAVVKIAQLGMHRDTEGDMTGGDTDTKRETSVAEITCCRDTTHDTGSLQGTRMI